MSPTRKNREKIADFGSSDRAEMHGSPYAARSYLQEHDGITLVTSGNDVETKNTRG